MIRAMRISQLYISLFISLHNAIAILFMIKIVARRVEPHRHHYGNSKCVLNELKTPHCDKLIFIIVYDGH